MMFLFLTNASPTVPLQPSTPEWLLKKKKKNGDVNPANVQESWFLGFGIFVRHKSNTCPADEDIQWSSRLFVSSPVVQFRPTV